MSTKIKNLQMFYFWNCNSSFISSDDGHWLLKTVIKIIVTSVIGECKKDKIVKMQ